MNRPTLKKSFALRLLPIIEAAEELMDHMDTDGENEDRAEKYVNNIFEVTMTELYGIEMWKWYREKQG